MKSNKNYIIAKNLRYFKLDNNSPELPYFWYIKNNLKNLYIKINKQNQIVVSSNELVKIEEVESFLRKYYYKLLYKINSNDLNPYINLKNKIVNIKNQKYQIVINDTKLNNSNKYLIDEVNYIIYIKNDNNIKPVLNKVLIEKNYDEFNTLFLKLQNQMQIKDITYSFKWSISKWGCYYKKTNSIIFSVQLLAYPVDCWKSIIIHELCHYYFFNHSKEFWQLVYKHDPNYKKSHELLKYYIY